MVSPAPNQPWSGNLPCCHGPRGGCSVHNPDRRPVFWNPSLPSNTKPASPGVLSSLLDRAITRSNNTKTDTLQPAITSSLPHTPDTCTPLPPIHPSVPYHLSLYHLHAAITNPALVPLLACHGTTAGSPLHPSLTWSATPLLARSAENTHHLLLKYTLTFSISIPGNANNKDNDLGYSKNWLISPFYRRFAPCAHCTRRLCSVRLEVSQQRQQGQQQQQQPVFERSVKVRHELRNVLGQEFRDVWESYGSGSGGGDPNSKASPARQPANLSCGMCYTDFGMGFADAGGTVVVTVWACKDLGGAVVGDEKWEAARGGRPVRRPRADFGRVRRAFERLEGGDSERIQGGGGQGADRAAEEEPPPPYTGPSS